MSIDVLFACHTGVCSFCKKEFVKTKTRNGWTVFCSSACYTQKRWGLSHKVRKLCSQCNTEFSTPRRKQAKYCSQKCYGVSLKGRQLKERRKRKAHLCSYCEKPMERRISQFRCFQHFFCSRYCFARYREECGPIGRNHPNWKGAEYPQFLRAYTMGWKRARRIALKNAKYKCQICATQERLDVHHLKPLRLCQSVEEAHSQNNLLVLCRRCHLRAEGKPEHIEMARRRIAPYLNLPKQMEMVI